MFQHFALEAQAGGLAPPGAQMAANGNPHAPPLTMRGTTGLDSDKFATGYLGGTGTATQFQMAGGEAGLPIRPPASNERIFVRRLQSRGLLTGQHLMTRWERPGNYNLGLGMDTWRAGSNCTWTLGNRAHFSPITGVLGPLTYPALPHKGVHRDPLPQFDKIRQGLAAAVTPPVILVTSTSGYQGGMSLGELRQTAAAQFQAARRMRAGARGAPSRGRPSIGGAEVVPKRQRR